MLLIRGIDGQECDCFHEILQSRKDEVRVLKACAEQEAKDNNQTLGMYAFMTLGVILCGRLDISSIVLRLLCVGVAAVVMKRDYVRSELSKLWSYLCNSRYNQIISKGHESTKIT